MLNSNDLENYIPKEKKNIFNYKFAKKLREQLNSCDELCNEYVKLIEQVIAPHILSKIDDDTILFQYPPSIRIYPSIDSSKPMGRLHSDNEYGHQEGEINFWLPITSANGNNTLWAESSRDQGDFHPFNLEYG